MFYYSMRIFVDIDNTISIISHEHTDYNLAKPLNDRIHRINDLYDQGHEIIYWTARGSGTGKLWFQTTHNQLTVWGCKFHELRMGKPVYDLFIDDKNIMSDTFFSDKHTTCQNTIYNLQHCK